MPDLPLDKAVVERMGYDNMVAATSFGDDHDLVEVGIVAPLEGGRGIFGDRWAVTVHFDCDPDRPCQGSSGVTDYPSLEDAAAEFESVVAEYSKAPSPTM